MSTLREALSDTQHKIWSAWMRWMFSIGTFNEDGTWTMPAALVKRWQRQMETPYAQLSEGEKDSDREQADKVLRTIEFVGQLTMGRSEPRTTNPAEPPHGAEGA
jgi:hypothetical protein